jgi:hypothetical protein
MMDNNYWIVCIFIDIIVMMPSKTNQNLVENLPGYIGQKATLLRTFQIDRNKVELPGAAMQIKFQFQEQLEFIKSMRSAQDFQDLWPVWLKSIVLPSGNEISKGWNGNIDARDICYLLGMYVLYKIYRLDLSSIQYQEHFNQLVSIEFKFELLGVEKLWGLNQLSDPLYYKIYNSQLKIYKAKQVSVSSPNPIHQKISPKPVLTDPNKKNKNDTFLHATNTPGCSHFFATINIERYILQNLQNGVDPTAIKCPLAPLCPEKINYLLVRYVNLEYCNKYRIPKKELPN